MSERTNVKIQATVTPDVLTIIDNYVALTSLSGSNRSELISDILRSWAKNQLEIRTIDPLSDDHPLLRSIKSPELASHPDKGGFDE